jgi:tetratricopeptide (TPR) repeat protein
MSDLLSRFPLPPVPEDQSADDVAAWSEPVLLRTYEPGEPGRLPAFLESRVYQGSSGRVYPLPFIESVGHEAAPRLWQAVHLENAYLRLVILPELGGRVHIAVDKTTGEDFFYRNDVIKPALVGLAGPWISGGIEFNWPQHHRPATFLPMDWTIERERDGSVTVWCSDHDPFARMKGMHGIRLRPGSAVLEARVRLFNRTETTQTFLWWANVAVRVHDEYQSFFPSDVHVVADHAKRAATSFPAADRPYYGIDYAARADRGSAEYVADDADRIDWYRNIPVPTSYMCVASDDDFFGGYDHSRRLGFAHIADHHIAPGKKQWTWGNAPFGWAWDANLSDDRSAYVELMAGVYTDNQPDFSSLAPGETKTFSQYWYPYHGIGPLAQATTELAVSLTVDGGPGERVARLGLAATRPRDDIDLTLVGADGGVLWQRRVSAAPGRPVEAQAPVPSDDDVELVASADGVELLRATTRYRDAAADGFETATEPPAPAEIESVDELYLTGVHLAQYRHATRSPEPYWAEALRRDPGDSRTHLATASARLASGCLSEAEHHLRAALARQTHRNPNPADGEASYLLGVVLAEQGRDAEADDAFAKAAWTFAWRVASALARARIAARADRWQEALGHAEQAARLDPDQLQAAAVRTIALRRLGRATEAEAVLAAARALDRLDLWLSDLAADERTPDAGTLRDLAGEYRSLGLTDDAFRVLERAAVAAVERPVPGAGDPLALIHYARAELLDELGRPEESADAVQAARTVSVDRCFAGGREDARLLERRIQRTGDARAHALLGHWLYFHRRYDEAIGHLESAIAGHPDDAVVLRGLGLAAYNVRRDPERAVRFYRRAVEADPDDPKLRYEADQLARRVGDSPAARLAALADAGDLIASRDDLTLAYAELLVLVGRHDEAVSLLSSRRFSPWEGGEGEVIRVWTLAQRSVAGDALARGDGAGAAATLATAIAVPASLGEAPHPLANRSDLLLAFGDANRAAGLTEVAEDAWRTAADSAGDFTTMEAVPHSPMTYYSVLAAQRLGDHERAQRLTADFADYVEVVRRERASIDYFATSLPTMLIFREDIDRTHRDRIAVMDAELALLAGDHPRAVALLTGLAERDPAAPLVRELLAEATTADAA